MAGLVFGKGVCTFISCNFSVKFDLIKKDVGLRVVTDGMREKSDDVSLDIMVTVLLWVQHLFPDLVE